MKVTKAVFMKGIVGDDEILRDNVPQIAFIGRSNVGKSSLINALTIKGLCRSSSTPGHTQEINFFLINNKYYLVDLPGYGYVKGSDDRKDFIWHLVTSYIFDTIQNKPKNFNSKENRDENISSEIAEKEPRNKAYRKIVVILDAKVGPTKDDITVIDALEKSGKDFLIAVNKIDKLNTNELRKSLANIESLFGGHVIIPCSTTKHDGIKQLSAECFK